MPSPAKRAAIAGKAATSGNVRPQYEVSRSGGGSSFPSSSPPSQTHPIASLSPYQNRWTIKARVMNKSAIRTYHNARGEGKLFSMELVDESGDIRATGFNNQVDQFYELMEINKVYYISKCSLKTANKQYTSGKHDYEMTLNSETQIIPCSDEDTNIPAITFNFVTIAQLKDMSKDTIIDVIGICKSTGDVQSLTSRTTNRELKKREVHLVDSSNTEVTLTLWGEQAENFDGSQKPVVAIKGAKLSDFGGHSLSTQFSSIVQVNPDIRESHVLRGWFDNEGYQMESESISSAKFNGQGSGSMSNWKTFREIKDEDLGNGDKPDFFTTKATVVLIRKENALYQACPSANCNKKVVDQNNGMYRCEKCNCEYHDFKWRLMVSVNLADFSDNQWVTCFQETAEVLLNETADNLGRMQSDDPEAFQNVINEAAFQSFVFRLRIKKEMYNDEPRMKTTAVEVIPLNLKDYNKRLLSEIKGML